LQYKFFKELGFERVRTGSTLFGSLVHQTIEDIHRAVLRGEQSTITESNISIWFENNYANLSKKEHSFLARPAQEAALKQVMRYADKQTGDWSRVIDAEVEISHVEPDYILNGRIDLIRGEGNTVEIVDFKAEKKPDMDKDRDGIARYHRQLQLYAYIVEQRLGLSVGKMHVYYTGETDGLPTVTFPNRASDMAQTVLALDRTIRKIQCRDFSGSAAQGKLCKDCDMRHYCGKI
jgi:DNA helicase-2/ATP-dependent DNA helicase PcrA